MQSRLTQLLLPRSQSVEVDPSPVDGLLSRRQQHLVGSTESYFETPGGVLESPLKEINAVKTPDVKIVHTDTCGPAVTPLH